MHLIATLGAFDEDDAYVSGDGAEALRRRRNERRSLTLSAVTSSPLVGETQVAIHDISVDGLLIETEPGLLSTDDSVELSLPERGVVRARVVWQSGRLVGCQFSEPVSAGAVSAALLKSDADRAPDRSMEAGEAVGPLHGRGIDLEPQLNFSVALVLSFTLWGLIGAAAYFLALI